jgi:hypothetical protein
MEFIVVGILAFIAGYALCFKHFRDDVTNGKVMAFKSGGYVASKVDSKK